MRLDPRLTAELPRLVHRVSGRQTPELDRHLKLLTHAARVLSRPPKPLLDYASLPGSEAQEELLVRRRSLWGVFRQSLVNKPFSQEALIATPVLTQFQRLPDGRQLMVTHNRKIFAEQADRQDQFFREQLIYDPQNRDHFKWRQTRWTLGDDPWVQQINGERHQNGSLITTTTNSRVGFSHLAYLAEANGHHKLYVNRLARARGRQEEFLTYWLMQENSRRQSDNLSLPYTLPDNAHKSHESVLMTAPNSTRQEAKVSTMLTQHPPSWAAIPHPQELTLPPM